MNHTRSIRWADTTLKWCGGRAAWQNDTFSFCLYIHGPHANVVNRFHVSQTQYSMICLPPHNASASEGALFSNSGSILDPCRIHSGPLGAELVPWTGMPIFFTTSDSRRFAHGIAKAMLDPKRKLTSRRAYPSTLQMRRCSIALKDAQDGNKVQSCLVSSRTWIAPVIATSRANLPATASGRTAAANNSCRPCTAWSAPKASGIAAKRASYAAAPSHIHFARWTNYKPTISQL